MAACVSLAQAKRVLPQIWAVLAFACLTVVSAFNPFGSDEICRNNLLFTISSPFPYCNMLTAGLQGMVSSSEIYFTISRNGRFK